MFVRALIFSLLLMLCGCVSLVARYDATFDESLNRLSEDTATFLAAASAGGSERDYASKEAVAYYAATYNVLDRLIERARLTRGTVPCGTGANLEAFAASPTSQTTLPEDHPKFDCREAQLYSVRLLVDQLRYAHASNGVLNKAEAKAQGNTLQAAILGAIETFITNKPES